MCEQPAGTPKSGKEPPSGPAVQAWRQRAAFTVFFESLSDPGAPPSWRTRVYHEESGEERCAEVTVSGLARLAAELVMTLFTDDVTPSSSGAPAPPRAPTSSPPRG